LFEQAVKLMKAKLGRDHPETLVAMNNLGRCYQETGRLAEALPLYEETLGLARNKPGLGPEHPYSLSFMKGLAAAYREAGRVDDAEFLYRELSGSLAKSPASAMVELARARALDGLGECLLEQSKFQDAETLFRQSLDIFEKRAADDWDAPATRSLLGAALLGQKKFADAEPLLVQAYGDLKDREKKIPKGHKNPVAEAANRVAQLYELCGIADKAAEWRRKAVSSSRGALLRHSRGSRPPGASADRRAAPGRSRMN